MPRRLFVFHSRVWLVVGLLALGSAAHAQRGGGRGGRGGGASGAGADTTRGFVITDATTRTNCQSCHRRDSLGMLQRISFERKTPEGWEMTVRRMVALNNVKLDPVAARQIVRYLSDNQGLAPAELRPGRFEVERRMIEYRYTADPRTETTCRACHSMGRVITQRRTRGEWELLVATHRALFPDVDFQAFRRGGRASNDSGPAQQPMDIAINHLARAFPLRTPEWTAWSATMRPPHLEGTWSLSGNQPGRGAFYGHLTVTRGASDGEFVTQATYRYADDGKIVQRTGKSIVYTGYQWRGRSSEPSGRGADTTSLREVMFVEPGWKEMSGRWFNGGYDEIGMDVSLEKLGANPVLAGVAPHALHVGTRGQDVTIFGANLPRNIAANAIDFGPGVSVQQVVRATPDSIMVRVNVDPSAAVGKRDLYAAGASLRDGAVVFNQISYIKVVPLAGLARVGGVVFPKQFQQFDAIAYYNGPDGKADTGDDLEIGRVNASWTLEEYAVTYDDDDVKFVGTINQSGLFTPNLDGPNPQRSANRDNVGDVWVVATYSPPGSPLGTPAGTPARPLRARAQLIVTVPLYVKFVQWNTQP
ncbi:MAG: quinohemoprotein amine dehydrogenase subunit alpha [Gemmatimonadaceae bacterium]